MRPPSDNSEVESVSYMFWRVNSYIYIVSINTSSRMSDRVSLVS